jgi:hypothetical protein
MSWKAVFENPVGTSSLRLRDRVSGNSIFLTFRDGVVVGAMGADPSRYVGLTEQQARHRARFSQRGDNPRYRYRILWGNGQVAWEGNSLKAAKSELANVQRESPGAFLQFYEPGSADAPGDWFSYRGTR